VLANGGFGLANGGFGLPNGGFVLANGGLRLPNVELGRPNGGFGPPNGGFGLANGGFGLPNVELAPSDVELVRRNVEFRYDKVEPYRSTPSNDRYGALHHAPFRCHRPYTPVTAGHLHSFGRMAGVPDKHRLVAVDSVVEALYGRKSVHI
jgi:hypothetical protein